jgi:hypothetical protein
MAVFPDDGLSVGQSRWVRMIPKSYPPRSYPGQTYCPQVQGTVSVGSCLVSCRLQIGRAWSLHMSRSCLLLTGTIPFGYHNVVLDARRCDKATC